MKNSLKPNRRVIAHLFVLFSSGWLLFGCNDRTAYQGLQPPDASQESAAVVYNWYKLMGQLELRTSPQPAVLANNRNFGYVGIGLYEAVRPGLRGAEGLSSKLYQMPTMPTPEPDRDYAWGASANAALASLFKQLFVSLSAASKARVDSLENAYFKEFTLSAGAATVARSQSFGRAVATVVYNWSETDNFTLSSQGYVLPVFPGAWVPTPPAFAAPVGPYLKDCRPFLASTLTATAPPMPIPYSVDSASPFYKEARAVYNIGKALTQEQQNIARWWADAGGVGVGVPAPYHNLSIINQVLEAKQARLGQAAEVYAKTGIAMRDGPIITFRAKFQYNLVRPVTYIQKYIDPSWQPLLPTPPYPEYPSGLVGNSAPVMQVLIREFGDIPVTDNAYAWRGSAARPYASLSQLMEEQSTSRVYAGIHYPSTQAVSVQMGRALGNTIADLKLRLK